MATPNQMPLPVSPKVQGELGKVWESLDHLTGVDWWRLSKIFDFPNGERLQKSWWICLLSSIDLSLYF
jgi:hypothetical protein